MSSKGPDDPAGKPPAPVLVPKNVQADLYTDSVVTIDPTAAARLREVAPEVSQGAWRERAFTPRGFMTKEEIVSGMRSELDTATASPGDLDQVRGFLKTHWLPLFRQAVEQAGGDGMDAHLYALFGRPKRVAKDPLLADLITAYSALNVATSREDLVTAGFKVIERISRALSEPQPPRISLKALESELEGRLNVDEILDILTSSDAELNARLTKVRLTLETIRNELRAGGTGGQPTSLLWNFTRIKAERIVIESERRRRGLS
jgi:hypothetical protein